MKNKIEHIPIAGDASERLFQFLEQVNFELAKKGVTEAFSVTYEIENAILEELKQLGKSTKITTDEIETVLAKFGTPVQIANNYGGNKRRATEDSEGVSDQLVNPLTLEKRFPLEIPPNARKLPKRKPNDHSTFWDIIKTNIEQALILLPLFTFISVLIQTLIGYSNVDYGFWVAQTVMRELSIAVLVFLVVEFFSGITGNIGFSYKVTVKIRDSVRITVFGTALTFIWIATNSETSDPYYLKQVASYWFLSGVIVETIVFLRDHLVGLAPLKPNFPKFSRIELIQKGTLALIVFLIIIIPINYFMGAFFMAVNLILYYLWNKKSVTFGFAYASLFPILVISIGLLLETILI